MPLKSTGNIQNRKDQENIDIREDHSSSFIRLPPFLGSRMEYASQVIAADNQNTANEQWTTKIANQSANSDFPE
jgi:hypothetical protein